jgi:hypothetical protein
MKLGNLRGALMGVIVASAAFAFPAAAAATISPKLTLDQSAGTAAGSTVKVGLQTNFQPSAGDGARNVTYSFPAGLWPNLNQHGGTCLTATTPTAACAIGTGLVNTTSVTVYLVKPRLASDVAGVELQGTLVAITGDFSLGQPPQTPGLDLSFTGLSGLPPITELDMSLSALRLPTSCPKTAATVGVSASSQLVPLSPATASAPLRVTGCRSLPFAPKVSGVITKAGPSTTVVTKIAEASGQSGLKVAEIIIPSSLKVQKVLGTCVQGAPCTVGTGSLTSPLLPSSAFATGTVTLGGTITKPVLTISFPAPYKFVLNGTVNYTTRGLVFSNVPDIPLSSFVLTITGPNGNSVFVTSCAPTKLKTKDTPQDGNPASTASGPITYHGCPPPVIGKPTASGSLSGLATGHPRLKVSATHGSNAPNIASLSVSLPAGLSFHAHKSGSSLKGLSVSGGSLASAKVHAGALVISLHKPSGSVSLTASGPLLTETKALETKAKKHKAGTIAVTVKVTNAKGKTPTITLKLAS